MRRLIFVHSHDETTDFLDEVIQSLHRNGYSDFDHFQIVAESKNADEVKSAIINAELGSTIVFLGHGASHSIYLPLIESQIAGTFIGGHNFDILNNKNLICLSCRSAEFIKNNFNSKLQTAMLGFDNLPTHWHDVSAEREMGDQFAWADITDDVLAHYRKMLVSIFTNALYDAITYKMNFNQFYLQLRLYTNRWMFKTANYSISQKPTLLANMLFDLKIGIRLFGASGTSLL